MGRRNTGVLVGAVALLVGLSVPVNASADGSTVNDMFMRRGADEVSPQSGPREWWFDWTVSS